MVHILHVVPHSTGDFVESGPGGCVGQMKKRFQAKRHDDPLSRRSNVGRGVSDSSNNWGNWSGKKKWVCGHHSKGFFDRQGSFSGWRLAGRRGGGGGEGRGSDLRHGWSGHKLRRGQGCQPVTRTVPVCGTVWTHERRTVWVPAMTIMDGDGSEGGAALGWSRSYLAAGWVGIPGLVCEEGLSIRPQAHFSVT